MVLDELKVKPEQILHIGDNTRADFQAPRNKGLKALRLRQNEEVTEEYLRLETSAVAIIDTDVRHQHPLPSPFHGVFASKPVPEDPGSQLGRYGIGPMMYAFGRFVLDEVQSLRDQGATPKPVFLLRDGYLPHEVCRSIAGEDVGEAISLSRFVAYACSFRDSESIYDYLTRMAGSKRFELSLIHI